MFKIVLVFLFASILCVTSDPPTDTETETETEIPGEETSEPIDQSSSWPFVKQVFPDNSVQSPVSIPTENACTVSLPPLVYNNYWSNDRNMSSVVVEIKNNGYAILVRTVQYPAGAEYPYAYITGGPLFDDVYILYQLHIFWGTEGEMGSENQIDGQGYPIEVQLIHYKWDYQLYKNAVEYDDGICVVSFVGQISDEDNPDMSAFINILQDALKQSGGFIVSSFNTYVYWLQAITENNVYFAFPGSITTSPYTQCASWIVYNATFMISETQLSVFRTLNGVDNSNPLTSIQGRPLQDFNDRPLVSSV